MADPIDGLKRAGPRQQPVMRAATWPERINSKIQDVYEGVANSPLGRVSDAVGLTGFQGIVDSGSDPNQVLGTALPVGPFNRAPKVGGALYNTLENAASRSGRGLPNTPGGAGLLDDYTKPILNPSKPLHDPHRSARDILNPRTQDQIERMHNEARAGLSKLPGFNMDDLERSRGMTNPGPFTRPGNTGPRSMAEAPTPGKAKHLAYWDELEDDQFNVYYPGHPSHNSTVGTQSLRDLGLAVPKVPKRPMTQGQYGVLDPRD